VEKLRIVVKTEAKKEFIEFCLKGTVPKKSHAPLFRPADEQMNPHGKSKGSFFQII